MGHRTTTATLGLGLTVSLIAPTAQAVPSPAHAGVVARAVPAAPRALATAKKNAKGTLKILVSGSGSYTVTGKRFRKSDRGSKSYRVKPGRYTIKAPAGSVKPGTVKVRRGKVSRVKITFPTTVTPTPTTSPTPTPSPTPSLPPKGVGPVQEWVDPGTTVTVSAGGGYAITVPAGALATRSLVSVTPLPAVDGVLPSADFHIDGLWTGSVAVRLPAPADMAGLESMVLHDAADGLRVTSGRFVTAGSADGLPTVTAEATSLSHFTAAGVECPADDQPLLRALVVGCSDHNGASVEDVWKSVVKEKWDQALALEQADAACGPASGKVAEVGAIIKVKMSCSFSAVGTEGKFRFTNTSDESVLGWSLPVVLGHADAGAPITSSKDNTNVQWLLTPLSELGEPQFLYPGAKLTFTKPENAVESDITWKVDRNATIATVYLQWVTAQIGAKAYDKGALKTALAARLLGCGRKGSQETAASCATDAVIDGAKTLLSAEASIGVSKILFAMDAGFALGTALDGLADPRTTTTHLINSTPTDPPTKRGGTSWIARNPDNTRAVLVDGATIHPITNGGTFNCLATTRVVWDIPTLRALRTATPQPAVCDNSGRTTWDIRPEPDGNVGTSIMLRDTSTTPHATYLINAAGELQTVPSHDYKCLAGSDPVIWNAPAEKIAAWHPAGGTVAACTGGSPGAVQRISVDFTGAQANSDSSVPAWSPDGSRIAFASAASNLVPDDTNGTADVFVKTLATGAVQRISTDAAGAQANGGSRYPVWSPDGTRILFSSDATNLFSDDTNNSDDLFIKTLATGALQQLSSNGIGTQANGSSEDAVWSPDGTRIAFTSIASNLVPGDTNDKSDVFVKLMATGAIQRISTAANGSQAEGDSNDPVWSPDGTQIAFYSYSSNLLPGDLDRDEFIKTLATGELQRLSGSGYSEQVNGNSFSPAWSPDGTQIAFVSWASNLVPDDTNGSTDLFVETLATGEVQRISTDAAGNESLGEPSQPAWSPDGTQIAFADWSSTLVPDDTNGHDVFVKSLGTGAVRRISTDATGAQGIGDSEYPVWSPDGTQIAFDSYASNLVPDDTNEHEDVFVKTLP